MLFEHMDAQSYTLDHGSCSAVLTLKLVNGLARRKRPESAPTSEGFAKEKVIPLVRVNVFSMDLHGFNQNHCHHCDHCNSDSH